MASTPVVKYLIIVNVVVFLLQIVVVNKDPTAALERLKKDLPQTDKPLSEQELRQLVRHLPKTSVIQEWLDLDSSKVVYHGQVWRVLTHAFCHDRYSLFHIFINMLCLYWFGSTLELKYGSREFLLFYLTAAVAAALAFIALDLYTGSTVPGIGASGAVMAVMMLYTMHYPYEEICVCWFFPLQMRWVMLLFLIWDLHPILLTLSGDEMFTGIAHAAHLGGLAFGFCYAKFDWHLESIVERLPGRRWRWKTRRRLAPLALHEPGADNDSGRVDELLEKIFRSGQASLTDEERAILEDASERLKGRPRSDG
jgi:membrane associated rhomboid family serine protease